ncbi:MAG: hypothetical protein KatS3mg104_0771 [Phycisphaerae bacterium]|nr:MAG: hypothetical protein KatS3mg104_0771 [Phycisphaerae bacterium]
MIGRRFGDSILGYDNSRAIHFPDRFVLPIRPQLAQPISTGR